TARAMHLPTGAYQDADGSCSFDEKVEKQRTIHNIRAHAITRAKNRAILDLVGFGEVSAEEINISEYESPSRQQTNGRAKTNGGGGWKASQKQANFIMKLAQDKGVDDNLLIKMLEKGFDVSNVSDLNSTDASKVIKMLQERTLEQIKEFAGMKDAPSRQDDTSLFDEGEVIDID